MQKKTLLSSFGVLLALTASAQAPAQTDSLLNDLDQRLSVQEEAIAKSQKLKISGYVQVSFQSGDKDATLKVGQKNDLKDETFSRLGVRRGRLKFTYTEGLATGVLQMDLTEKGLCLKDAYLKLTAPSFPTLSLQAGVFDRPFGHEISFSSSRRESPERSMVVSTLFPNERDLGSMLTLQADKNSAWHFLKLQAGLFAGNSIAQETDSRLDFIGRLSATRSIGNSVEWGLGASYYEGSVRQGTESIFRMTHDGFVQDKQAAYKGAYAARRYFGIDGQLNICSSIGVTRLRGEWITGRQPGSLNSSESPKSATPSTTDTYLRDVQGGYLLFSQDWGTSPLSTIVKYDWYDPNTKVSGNQLDQFKGISNKGDLSHQTLGLGVIGRIDNNTKITAYYELLHNETSAQILDQKDNRFTLTLQYKF